MLIVEVKENVFGIMVNYKIRGKLHSVNSGSQGECVWHNGKL